MRKSLEPSGRKCVGHLEMIFLRFCFNDQGDGKCVRIKKQKGGVISIYISGEDMCISRKLGKGQYWQ